MGLFDSLMDMPGKIGDMFDSMMNPQNGYNDAGKMLQEFFQKAMAMQQPYATAGQDQLGKLTGMQNELSDPAALENKWAQGYQTSPYAQQMMNQAKDTGMNEASSMGLMGSSPAISNIQTNASNIMNADRSSYLNDLMDKYKTGVGIGQNIYDVGAGTAAGMGRNAMDQGTSMGNVAFGSANAPGMALSNLLQMMMKGGMMMQGGGGFGG